MIRQFCAWLTFTTLMTCVAFGLESWQLYKSDASESDAISTEILEKKLPKTKILPSGPQNALTEDDVLKWFKKQDLVARTLAKKGCLKVSLLRNKLGYPQTSATARQVFLISTKCSNPPQLLFVLKEYNDVSRVTQEIQNLEELKKTFRTLGYTKEMPRIVFPEATYSFRIKNAMTQKPEVRFLSLIHAADGKSLYQLIEEWSKSSPAESSPLLKTNLLRAMSQLGRVMANLHLRYMSGEACPLSRVNRVKKHKEGDITNCHTKIHGDLHIKNIFWNGQQISLIDIESFAMPTGETNFINEIMYFYGTLVDFSYPLFKSTKEDQTKRYFIVVTCFKEFLHHYIESFGKTAGPHMTKKLLEILNESGFGIARLQQRAMADEDLDFWKKGIKPFLRKKIKKIT